MPDRTIPLETSERARLVASLTAIRNSLDAGGEMLAAIHVTHAIERIKPSSPSDEPVVNLQG